MPVPLGTPATPDVLPTIMLVDDDDIGRAFLRTFLSHAGFAVHEAAGGAAAIAMQRERPADLVLMNVQMPQVDGIAAAGGIRATEVALRRRRVPILAFTATASPCIRERCISAGMDDCMTMPLDYSELLTYVSRWLRRPAKGMMPAAAEQSGSQVPG